MTGLGLTLTLVRHGESVGNVAAAQAQASNSEVVDVPARDADVCLSERGIAQARALGSALAAGGGLPAMDSLWCSPYLRAQQTAQICLEEAGVTVPGRIDERLRDRDLGVLDTLTGDGIQRRYPEEAARRRWLGKFYHRPAGESWARCDRRRAGRLDTGLLERELLDELPGRLDVFTGEMPGMTCGERGISGKGGGCTRVHR